MINRSRTAAALVISSLLALTACGTGPEPSDGQAPVDVPDPVHNYVALGDSYASLGGTGAVDSGSTHCRRSADNYPANVLADERVTGHDVSCQGAVIDDVLHPRDVGEERLPAQIDSLSDHTDLVTLSIGGNDIGFGAIVGCFFEAMNMGEPSNCAADWAEPIDGQLAGLPDRLDQVYEAIDERAGDVRVMATGYMPVLAPGDECAEIASVSPPDREWIVELTGEINQLVAEAAERNGAEMVLPDGVAEHTGCAEPGQRWVDFFGQETGAYPMHPTPAGQTAMAQAVLDRL